MLELLPEIPRNRSSGTRPHFVVAWLDALEQLSMESGPTTRFHPPELKKKTLQFFSLLAPLKTAHSVRVSMALLTLAVNKMNSSLK